MLNTINEIVDDFYPKLSPEDISEIRKTDRDHIFKWHHTVGMYIRNNYELWNENHPLTKEWHFDSENNFNKYVVDGIDYHPNHPDEVSNRILEAIWLRVNTEILIK